jgi:hypothetical protein
VLDWHLAVFSDGVAFIFLQKVLASQFRSDPQLIVMDRAASKRNWITARAIAY